MAYIKNIDPNPGERVLTDLGLVLSQGEWTEVADDLAESLAKQSVWQVVDSHGNEIKAANKRANDSAEADAEAAAEEATTPVSTLPGAEVADPELIVESKPKRKATKAKSTEAEEAK